jgi:hypothetical protein
MTVMTVEKTLEKKLETIMAHLAASPACRCAVCAARRATQLTQALEDKFGLPRPREEFIEH